MRYKVVFDVARSGYGGWQIVALGAALFIGGLLWDVLLSRVGKPQRFRWPARCFVAAMFLLFFAASFPRYIRLRTALASGHCKVVVGRVSHFVPGVEQGRSPESFVVAGHHFSYGNDFSSAGFNMTQPRGGPMRNGLLVRVTHWNGEIARLEVAEPSEPNAKAPSTCIKYLGL